jgi:hypothetical protein
MVTGTIFNVDWNEEEMDNLCNVVYRNGGIFTFVSEYEVIYLTLYYFCYS